MLFTLLKKVRDSLDVKPFYLRKDTAEQTKARQEEYINFIKTVQNVLSNVKTKGRCFTSF